MLVPEISLTPQTVDRFIARFGEENIAVLHSKLSIGERFDQWNKIKNGQAKIVIGARSAIFAPIKDLGIIIIDEEHDSSYKSESTPRYNAKELIASGKPVVIDFWAEWCGPCRAIAPSVDELAEEYEGKVIIGKYNVDDDTDLSAEYSIRNIPTLLFFKEGKLVDKHVGSASKADLEAKIKALL